MNISNILCGRGVLLRDKMQMFRTTELTASIYLPVVSTVSQIETELIDRIRIPIHNKLGEA